MATLSAAAAPTKPPFFLALAAFFALAAGDHVLYNGEVLMPGQNLTNGPHHLSMQPNCNLVLRRSGKPAWSTNSTFNSTGGGDGGPGCYAALKQNGELVIRRDVHYILWTSAKRAKKGKYVLVLDSAGRLGVYGSRRWVSSNPKEGGPKARRGPTVETEYVLSSGKRLLMGKSLRYDEYELGLSGCNLVINSTRSGRTLWQTNTKAATCYLELGNNGELMVKHGSQRIWSSNRKGEKGRYVAALRFDGRFAVYGPILWVNAKFDDSAGNGYPPVDRFREEIMTWKMD